MIPYCPGGRMSCQSAPGLYNHSDTNIVISANKKHRHCTNYTGQERV
ncbi:unnamed protein product, partial [Staurois parvus]